MSIIRNFVIVSVALLTIFNRPMEAVDEYGATGSKDTVSVAESQYAKLGMDTDIINTDADSDDDGFTDEDRTIECTDTLYDMGFRGNLALDCTIIREIRQYGEYISEQETHLNLLEVQCQRLKNDIAQESDLEQIELLKQKLQKLEEEQSVMEAKSIEFTHLNGDLKRLLVEISVIMSNMKTGINSNADIQEDHQGSEEERKLTMERKNRFVFLMKYVEYIEKFANRCKEPAKPRKIIWLGNNAVNEAVMDFPEAPAAPTAPVGNLAKIFCFENRKMKFF